MLKANVCKAGEITDVVASIGAWWQKGPVLEQSLDEYNKVYGIVRPGTGATIARIASLEENKAIGILSVYRGVGDDKHVRVHKGRHTRGDFLPICRMQLK